MVHQNGASCNLIPSNGTIALLKNNPLYFKVLVGFWLFFRGGFQRRLMKKYLSRRA